ncbi:flagellar protein FlgN [Pragia fontium]|uniref:FlgN protein n=1 Tax=Pragia fontium TaxID=82985 RepID=A0ABQ5LIY9_9GAMM|nr:flagellar protein FlgN [Pragia fontium]AKJ41381.1 hypothetical protein QQ39_04235 [Pragia fontium]GKX62936.1 hypothetical protein SOASR032_15050 [Pragia fontium]SUB81629.1 FlgN protein [Pragia fontium]VEJ54097.1 FlgN protein [Pragia fontium]
MKTLQEQVKELLSEIQSDRKYYIKLIHLLKQQHTMIIERKTDAIDELNQHMTTIYNLLAESTRKRMATLKNLCIPPHAEGMRFLFSRLPATHHIQAKALWDDLELRVRECKELNERNAHILTMQQDIVNTILGHEPDPIYQR